MAGQVKQATQATQDEPKRLSVTGRWTPQEDGSLAFVLPKEAVEALIAGDMHASSTGKTRSPLSIGVPALDVEREDGGVTTFRGNFAVYAPNEGSGRARIGG